MPVERLGMRCLLGCRPQGHCSPKEQVGVLRTACSGAHLSKLRPLSASGIILLQILFSFLRLVIKDSRGRINQVCVYLSAFLCECVWGVRVASAQDLTVIAQSDCQVRGRDSINDSTLEHTIEPPSPAHFREAFGARN